MKKSCENKRNPSRLCPKTGQARDDVIFYTKGLLIMLIWIFGIFGSFGSVDLGFSTAGQALKQVCVSLALIALIARPKEVCQIAYHLLFGMHRQAHSLSRNVRNVHRSS